MPQVKLDAQTIILPADTTANRPGSPSSGMMRYNTSLGYVESYDSSGVWKSLDSVLYVHHFEDATRNISLSNTNAAVIISFDITKKYAGSYLVMKGITPLDGTYSYQTGEYAEIGGTRKYEAAHFHPPFNGNGSGDYIYGSIFWDGIWTDQLTTGTKTINLGYSVRDGGSGNRWADYANPENRGGRARSRTTVIEIYEVDPSSITNIT